MTPQNVTLVIVLSLVGVMLVWGIIKPTRRGRIVALFPNLAVSLGILGTFVGVLIGLWRFDVTDISNSIPVLLGGLRTAFITSIAGLIVSIILKGVYAHADSQADPDPEREALESFARQLAELSTTTIAETLKNVVEDFNAHLNELVSESFRELSSAMVKLTEWQQNYRESMDDMEGNIKHLMSTMTESVGILERAARDIAQIDDRFASITRSSAELAVVGRDLAAIAENLGEQSSVLRESLVAIQKVGEDARSVLPSMSTHIDALTGQLEESVQQATQGLSSQSARVLEFVEDAIGRIESADQKQAEAVSASLRELDRSLEDQLTKALNSLAGRMASLSAKFAEDYGPLTEHLREVVRIAETVPAKDRTYGGDG